MFQFEQDEEDAKHQDSTQIPGGYTSKGEKRRLEFGATEGEDEEDCDSSASTVILSPSCSSTISSQDSEGDHQVITSTPVKQADVLGKCIRFL